ncbi:MAG: hypothetical protein A2831_03040 [Candidatus Yanofskybacteria bacterium RIFCSPHIGHO2_01_FULL_44_17]|uniref:Uncharacterized protein n=1 Tax=Candidatus Yanofskybacteria bacterium RIFCSPHIGHO2_01_FULL_44_17 TaxID=1802668 RepID=A0A1F8EY98_9BACT|nr:MAG: hypothetical protein A2831_03040 [Candidatus Yanofskybacteria bacterium RIFCSPHIGHO2_01_FULL_44_17]
MSSKESTKTKEWRVPEPTEEDLARIKDPFKEWEGQMNGFDVSKDQDYVKDDMLIEGGPSVVDNIAKWERENKNYEMKHLNPEQEVKVVNESSFEISSKFVDFLVDGIFSVVQKKGLHLFREMYKVTIKVVDSTNGPILLRIMDIDENRFIAALDGRSPFRVRTAQGGFKF